jgi:hypothetical protein
MRRFPFSLPLQRFAPPLWATRRSPPQPARQSPPPPARRSPPLPITVTTIALLLLLPALGLSRWPRPRAEGLEQLMGAASLLQSFPPSPDRPLPELWAQRFGRPQAEALWRRQRRPWWQFWGPHADGAPYLAISSLGFPGGASGPLPPNGLRVGDLVVVAPDPLSRQLLADRLRPQQRRSRGLHRGCLQRLEQEQAVFWNPSALGVIVGPVAPLLQRFQEGCLALELEPRGLRWQGEAAAVDGLLAPSALTSAGPWSQSSPLPPLPSDLLLELEGASLDQLLQGLLARQLIREPLASRYGIDESRLPQLRQAPFRLRLRPLPSGPFQASLELELAVGGQQRDWEQVLVSLAKALQEQGLAEAAPSAATPPAPASSSDPARSGPALPPVSLRRAPTQPTRKATWSREDGVVVGGWRWLSAPGRDTRLLLFLGPPPEIRRAPGGTVPGADPLRDSPPSQVKGPGEVTLRVRPAALDQLGLLPPEMPLLVRRSEQLSLEAAPLTGSARASDPISRLRGRLQVAR